MPITGRLHWCYWREDDRRARWIDHVVVIGSTIIVVIVLLVAACWVLLKIGYATGVVYDTTTIRTTDGDATISDLATERP